MARPKETGRGKSASALPPPSPPEMPARVLWGWFALALAVRIINLGRAPLWGDEILFVRSSIPPLTPIEIVQDHWERFLVVGHFPLPWIVQNIYQWVMSWFFNDLLHQPFIQRLPAVLWSSASVPLFYRLGTCLVPKRVAATATLFLTFFFFVVYHSREAYVYPPLMFFALGTFYYLFKVLREENVGRRTGALLFMCLVGAEYSHLTGALLTATVFVVTTVVLLINKYPRPIDPARLRTVGLRLWLIGLGSLALVAPFFLQRFVNPQGHQWPAPPDIPAVLHDFFGKIFLGVNFPLWLLPWILLVGGIVACLERDEWWFEKRTMLLLTVLLFVGILFSVATSQYAPRYFYTVVPFVYCILALGIDWGVKKIGAKLELAPETIRRAPWGVAGLALAVHVFLFLPPGYKLPARSLDHGAIAEWLNENLEPGTPYVYESGYDHRWVPGYFPTPDLVSAVPYIHGPGPEEMQKLRERQRRFFLQFPVSCYIEASRHGLEPGTPYDVWEWPHQFFQRSVVLRNEPLDRMYALGIFPGFYKSDPRIQIIVETPIWYNTEEDVEAMTRQSGQPVFLSYPQWQCREINRGTYARVASSPRAVVRVKNLRGEPVRGRFSLHGGVAAAVERSFPIEVRFGDDEIFAGPKWSSVLWSAETEPVTVPPGTHELVWGVPDDLAGEAQALILNFLQFQPL